MPGAHFYNPQSTEREEKSEMEGPIKWSVHLRIGEIRLTGTPVPTGSEVGILLSHRLLTLHHCCIGGLFCSVGNQS